jgi:hypothetical protein
MECQKEQNKKQYCNCTYSCGKKGACCDCLHYHRQMGQLPACYFPEDVEKTYDRSIDRFIKLYQQRGRWW